MGVIYIIIWHCESQDGQTIFYKGQIVLRPIRETLSVVLRIKITKYSFPAFVTSPIPNNILICSFHLMELNRMKILLNYDKLIRINIGLFKVKSLNLK